MTRTRSFKGPAFSGNKLEKNMRKIATIILLSASLFAAACNTVKGVGEDIESVGNAGDKVI